MARAFRFEAYPTSPPLPVLRAATAVLAPLGRALGRRVGHFLGRLGRMFGQGLLQALGLLDAAFL